MVGQGSVHILGLVQDGIPFYVSKAGFSCSCVLSISKWNEANFTSLFLADIFYECVQQRIT